MQQISLNTGLLQLEITDENGNVLGIFSTNPSDVNLPHRLSKGHENITKMLDEFGEKMKELEEQPGSDKEQIELLYETDKNMKQELDWMFNSDVSGLFGSVSMMTPAGGSVLIINFLNSVIPAIEKKANKEFKDFSRKERYTGKYNNQNNHGKGKRKRRY